MPQIVYLQLLHNNPDFALSIINRCNADFYVHVDSKSNCFSDTEWPQNVFVTDQRNNVTWGGFSIINTLIMCCKEILRNRNVDFVILLSGADYPVKSVQYINEYIASHPNTDFIQGQQIPNSDCHWLEGGRRRLECYALHLGGKNIATIEPRKIDFGNLRQFGKIALNTPSKLYKALKIWLKSPKREHPKNLIPYRGEMWWGLRRSTIEQIMLFLDKHPEYIEYHKDTCIPDEIFFNTLVYNIIPRDEICNDCLRFINWGKSVHGCSPFDITLDDKELISDIVANPQYLFARKITDIKVANYINNLINAQ